MTLPAQDLSRALEREVVAQPRAVQALVRSVTISRSGLNGGDAPAGRFLFLGPSGTGKTHMALSLARALHGDTERLAVVDCVQLERQDEWQELLERIAPHFRYTVPGHGTRVLAMAPLSILLVEHLEAATPTLAQALMAAFETGRIALPDDASGSLQGCLVLMTSRLCAREIFGEDRQEIGFSPATGDIVESEKARIYNLCCSAVERGWGCDFLGHLDDLIIFHRLRGAHLSSILQRLLDELNGRLAADRVRVELDEAATRFLLERGARFLQHGAWYLGKVFRRFVTFPMADLVASERLQPGTRVEFGLADDELRCSMIAEELEAHPPGPDDCSAIDVPLAGEADPATLVVLDAPPSPSDR
jgi:ATP-dependent Clp protease ATP-binding subunit ClpC